MSVFQKKVLVGVLLGFISQASFAHTGNGIEGSMFAGLLHPFTGIDHLLVMLVVGLLIGSWSGTQQARGIAGFGAVFLVAMILGIMTTTYLSLEFMLAASVVVAGLLLVIRSTLGTSPMMLFVLAAAGLHGYVHGTETASANALAWMAGVIISVVSLTTVAMLIGKLASQRALLQSGVRLLGYIVMTAGVALSVA